MVKQVVHVLRIQARALEVISSENFHCLLILTQELRGTRNVLAPDEFVERPRENIIYKIRHVVMALGYMHCHFVFVQSIPTFESFPVPSLQRLDPQ